MKKTEQLKNDLDLLKQMSKIELGDYAKRYCHDATGRTWSDFNKFLNENGMQCLRLATSKMFKESGLPIPAEPYTTAPNPHFKKAGEMKLYLL